MLRYLSFDKYMTRGLSGLLRKGLSVKQVLSSQMVVEFLNLFTQ